MPSTIVNPHDTRSIDRRPQGYVVKASKTQWSRAASGSCGSLGPGNIPMRGSSAAHRSGAFGSDSHGLGGPHARKRTCGALQPKIRAIREWALFHDRRVRWHPGLFGRAGDRRFDAQGVERWLLD